MVALDADRNAVELLYRQIRREPAAIAPMVVDLSNPSPALGFMNRERSAFVDRVRGDCVLALALIHHLLVAGNLSLEAICELLASLTRPHLVLEFVPADDEMFRRLMKFRRERFEGLALEPVRDAAGQAVQPVEGRVDSPFAAEAAVFQVSAVGGGRLPLGVKL